MLRALCIALWASLAGSTASGYNSWTCRPSQHTTAYTVAGASAPFFGLRLLSPNNSIATGYTPGLSQTVELYSVVSGAKIAGVVAGAFTGALTACPSACASATMAGPLTAFPGTTYSRPMSGCIGGMTHTSAQSSTSFKFAWTSPATQTGTVSVWTIVVGSGDTYEAISATYTGIFASSSTHTPTGIPTPTSIPIATGSDTPSATPTLGNTVSLTTTVMGRRSHTPTPTPTSTPTSTAPLTLTPTSIVIPTAAAITVTVTGTPVAVIPPPPNALTDPFAANEFRTTQQFSPLNIAAVSIAGIFGLVGVVFVLYHLFQQKKRQPVTNSTKNESVITIMPSGLSYV